jgi:hypothetical protein
MQNPTIGRVVIYRSRTGAYSVPAIITATHQTLNPAGVAGGHIADLTGEHHVHLTVLTPGKPGKRGEATDFVARADAPISENVAGCYQEWDVPWAGSRGGQPLDTSPESDQPAGTWAWPM